MFPNKLLPMILLTMGIIPVRFLNVEKKHNLN